MDLGAFAGGAGQFQRGAEERDTADIGTRRALLQTQQLDLQTKEMQKQYDALQASRADFANAPDPQTAFNTAAANMIQRGYIDQGMALQNAGIQVQNNGIKHALFQAVSGADPQEVSKTWSTWNPTEKLDHSGAVRATAADVDPGHPADPTKGIEAAPAGKYAGIPGVQPNDIIFKGQDGQPHPFHVNQLSVMFGIRPPPMWKAGADGLLYDQNSGASQVVQTIAPYKPGDRFVDVTTQNGDKVPVDITTPEGQALVAKNAGKILGGNSDLGRKQLDEINNQVETAYKGRMDLTTASERASVVQNATWLVQEGAVDERGHTMNANTAVKAAMDIFAGKAKPGDFFKGKATPQTLPPPASPQPRADAQWGQDYDDKGNKIDGKGAWFVPNDKRSGWMRVEEPAKPAAKTSAKTAPEYSPNPNRTSSGTIRQGGVPAAPAPPAPPAVPAAPAAAPPVPSAATPGGLARIVPPGVQVPGQVPQQSSPLAPWQLLNRGAPQPYMGGQLPPLPRAEGGLVRVLRR